MSRTETGSDGLKPTLRRPCHFNDASHWKLRGIELVEMLHADIHSVRSDDADHCNGHGDANHQPDEREEPGPDAFGRRIIRYATETSSSGTGEHPSGRSWLTRDCSSISGLKKRQLPFASDLAR